MKTINTEKNAPILPFEATNAYISGKMKPKTKAQADEILAIYFADLAIVNLTKPHKVQKDNLLYKCNWSPFEGETFKGDVETTIVSGHIAYHNGVFDENVKGKRLMFGR